MAHFIDLSDDVSPALVKNEKSGLRLPKKSRPSGDTDDEEDDEGEGEGDDDAPLPVRRRVLKRKFDAAGSSSPGVPAQLSASAEEALELLVSMFPDADKNDCRSVVASLSEKTSDMSKILEEAADMILTGRLPSAAASASTSASGAAGAGAAGGAFSASAASASAAVDAASDEFDGEWGDMGCKATPLDEVLSVFPNASHDYVNNLLLALPVEAVINNMVEKGYERQPKATMDLDTDYTVTSWETSIQYRANALVQLQRDFPILKLEGLRRLFSNDKNKHHYTPTLRLIESTLNISAHRYPDPVVALKTFMIESMADGLTTLGLKVSSSVPRNPPEISEWDPVFKRELRSEEKRREAARLELERQLEAEHNDKMAEASGAMIECGCCYGEYAFENLIQCSEGHLFCCKCIQSWVSQTVFGDGKSSVKCLATAEACCGGFPDSMLRKALTTSMYSKLQDAMASDALKAAQLENTVKCYSCSLIVEMPEEAGIVMNCQRCCKETCRLCGEESHVPLKCSEVEKSGSKNIRVQVEEAMTKARVRECHSCKARFYKVEGCNKMACVCGCFICYICRADITKEKYAHFCQTPHCTHETCGKCVLFTDSVTDDRKAMYEAGLNTTKAIEGQMGADVSIDMNKLLEGGVPLAKKAKNGGAEELQWAVARPNPGGGGVLPPGFNVFLPAPAPPPQDPRALAAAQAANRAVILAQQALRAQQRAARAAAKAARKAARR